MHILLWKYDKMITAACGLLDDFCDSFCFSPALFDDEYPRFVLFQDSRVFSTLSLPSFFPFNPYADKVDTKYITSDSKHSYEEADFQIVGLKMMVKEKEGKEERGEGETNKKENLLLVQKARFFCHCLLCLLQLFIKISCTSIPIYHVFFAFFHCRTFFFPLSLVGIFSSIAFQPNEDVPLSTFPLYFSFCVCRILPFILTLEAQLFTSAILPPYSALFFSSLSRQSLLLLIFLLHVTFFHTT